MGQRRCGAVLPTAPEQVRCKAIAWTPHSCCRAGRINAVACPFCRRRRLPGEELRQHAAEAAGLDMYGRALVGNAWLGPSLQAREPGPAAAAGAPAAASQAATFLGGSMVVTGGMGALGTLMAHWLASLGGCKLWLLGRTGRTGGLYMR